MNISDTATCIARITNNGAITSFNRGVGFFLKLGAHTVLVSNRHVIHPFESLTIEVPLKGKITLSSEHYKSISHKETDVDLAIVPIDRLKEDDPVFWYQIEPFVLPELCIISRQEAEHLPVMQEIAAVMMLYNPTFDDVFTSVVRKGIITSPISITRDLLLTDLFCTEGNSGSPVFLLPYDGSAPRLAAIVKQRIDNGGNSMHLTLCQNAYSIADFHRWL